MSCAFSTRDLARQLAAAALPSRRLLLAYSGGLDSSVLLHALSTLAASGELDALRAVHVHHGLHAEADTWCEHCRRQAAASGVVLDVAQLEVRRVRGESLEMAARRGRYALLAARLAAGEVLVTAHHGDDQLETVLLRLLRGSGPLGLAGMRVLRPFACGALWRPLLGAPRAALLEYARRHALVWVEDSSNADPAHDRNYLRARVLPAIERRWPQAARTVTRSAALAAEADELLAELAAADAAGGLERGPLSLERLGSLSAARQRNVLRQALRARGLPLPSRRRLEEARRQAVDSAAGRSPLVRWPGAELRRHGNDVHLLGMLPPVPPGDGTLRLDAPWRDALGELRLVPASAATGLGDAHARAGLTVRYRRGGESFRPAGAARARPLTRWLAARGLPPWWRDRLPLLFDGDELVAVAGVALSHQALGVPDAPRWRVHWTPAAALGPPPPGVAGHTDSPLIL